MREDIRNPVDTGWNLFANVSNKPNNYRCWRLTLAATSVATRMETQQTVKILENMTNKDVGDTPCEKRQAGEYEFGLTGGRLFII